MRGKQCQIFVNVWSVCEIRCVLERQTWQIRRRIADFNGLVSISPHKTKHGTKPNNNTTYHKYAINHLSLFNTYQYHLDFRWVKKNTHTHTCAHTHSRIQCMCVEPYANICYAFHILYAFYAVEYLPSSTSTILHAFVYYHWTFSDYTSQSTRYTKTYKYVFVHST